jgi:tetratricopeptide (TPR) repeat protein
MHHYCWGLMNTNRAILLVRDQRWRTHHLNYSIAEFDYVIRSASPNFKLLPEVLTKKGENLIRLDRGQEGIVELQRAIELKPDYWPPYAAISDYYRTIGDLAKARESLEEGLSASPNTKALMRRLAEIDTAKDNSKTAPQRTEKSSTPKSSVEKSAAQRLGPTSQDER